MYCAHINEKKESQTVQEHSINTAKMAKEFAIFPLKSILFDIGLLHDIGKYQQSFQRRIKGDMSIIIPHALCGAKEIGCLFEKSYTSILMEYCISGHHSGIQNFGTKADTAEENTLYGTLQRKTEDYSIYKTELFWEELKVKEIDVMIKGAKELGFTNQQQGELFAFLTRYAFSCLTDADSIDTQNFCQGTFVRPKSNFANCLNKLNKKFQLFCAITPLQQARQRLQNQVYKNLDSEKNMFLMNMPTGSGKTLCSIKWALERTIKKNKKRIIYIIPYNSIIDQTAEVLEEIFDKDLKILRHQSTFQYDNDNSFDEEYHYKKLSENWDCDFILTTAVQFFESIYANKRGKLRKLHNMQDAILIFDEAHLMPTEYLQPCLNGIFHITSYLNSEAVFLTATMPNFQKMFTDYCGMKAKIVELIYDKEDFDKFYKCTYKYMGQTSIEEILNINTPSKLIVVNSKKKAREIYEKAIGEKYHLSTYMIGKDRVRIISLIKERLKLLEEFSEEEIPEDRKITVVSTSLIEAGVDLDFYTVFRELTGLDSILQAGGRCNREGKHRKEKSKVYIFQLSHEIMHYNACVAKEILQEHTDINKLECIEIFYEKLFTFYSNDINKNRVSIIKNAPYNINFKTYAENFKMIDEDNAVSIIIPCDEYSKKLMEDTKLFSSSNIRKLQLYMASIKIWEFEELRKLGVLEDFDTGAYFLMNLDYYNDNTGILFQGRDYYI